MGNSIDGILVFSNVVVQILKDKFSQMQIKLSRLCLIKYIWKIIITQSEKDRHSRIISTSK